MDPTRVAALGRHDSGRPAQRPELGECGVCICHMGVSHAIQGSRPRQVDNGTFRGTPRGRHTLPGYEGSHLKGLLAALWGHTANRDPPRPDHHTSRVPPSEWLGHKASTLTRHA